MSKPNTFDRVPLVPRLAFLLLVLGPATLPAGPVRAAGGKPKTSTAEGRTPIGKNGAAAGMLLQREYSGTAWQPVKPQGTIFAGDRLMTLPGMRADIDTRDGGVRLTLWGNVPELSSFPVLESGVAVNAASDVDLDIRLFRGRVLLANHKDKGPVQVRVGFYSMTYDLTLAEPGTEVALELYGRWPPGYPVVLKPSGPQDVPTTSLGLHVLKGQANLKVGPEQYALQAPPGAAYFQWDNVRGQEGGPRRRDKVPAWAEPDALGTPGAKAVQAAVAQLSGRLGEKSVDAVLADALTQGDAVERELATYSLGAIDDLPRLADALADAKHADVRAAAVEALKNWVGRGAGQDRDVYEFFHQNRGYTEAQAETVVQLLHGFSQEDRNRPETYETLIAYLESGKLPIRQPGQWVPVSVGSRRGQGYSLRSGRSGGPTGTGGQGLEKAAGRRQPAGQGRLINIQADP